MAFDTDTTEELRLERQLAYLSLAARDSSGSAQRSADVATEDWRSLIELADAWRVTPRLIQLVERAGIQLAGDDMAFLRRAFLGAYGRSNLIATRTLAAVSALEAAGIRVVAFKGLASCAFLYHDLRQRSIYDADLLVDPSQVDAALECLQPVGFQPKGQESLAEYRNFVANSPGFAGNRAIALVDPKGAELDLHWEVQGAGMDAREILDRAVTAPLLHATLPFASPQDCFLLTVHHSIRENLSAAGMIRDLLDVQLWSEYFCQQQQLPAVVRHAKDKNLTAGALALLDILSVYGSTPEVEEARRQFQNSAGTVEARSAQRLTALFEFQLEHGRIEKDMLYLVHARPGAQVIRGLWNDWTGYRKSMTSMDAYLERPSLARRLEALVRVLPKWRQLRMLRELARLKYRRDASLDRH